MNRQAAREAFYRALLDDNPEELYERAPVGYLSTTPDGTIIKVNQTFLTWTGYDREQLVGRRTFAELLTAGGRIYHETHFAPMLLMQDSVREVALEVVRDNGQRLPVLVNSTLERDEEGKPQVVRTAIFDATERRQYEQELLRAKQQAEESEARARSLARTLQQTLIPPTPPDIPGLDVAAAYRPAGDGEEVGGDFYDIFQIGPGDWVVALGDVCGKGVDAAVVTSLVRHTLRAVTVQQSEPCEALAALNRVLLNDETEKFCTLALLRLRQVDGVWTVSMCSAGHPLPLQCREGEQPTTVGEFGSLVGVLESPSFRDTDLRLEPGTGLLLYTDGVTEARLDGELFGEDRLHACVAKHVGSAAGVIDGVMRDVMDFQQGDPRDDIAIVAVRAP